MPNPDIDQLFYILLPLFISLLLAVGGLIMAFDPGIQELKKARAFMAIAIASSSLIPIYITVISNSSVLTLLSIDITAGAVIALILYAFLVWINGKIARKIVSASAKREKRHVPS